MPLRVGFLQHVQDDLAKDVFVGLRHGLAHQSLTFDLLVLTAVWHSLVRPPCVGQPDPVLAPVEPGPVAVASGVDRSGDALLTVDELLFHAGIELPSLNRWAQPLGVRAHVLRQRRGQVRAVRQDFRALRERKVPGDVVGYGNARDASRQRRRDATGCVLDCHGKGGSCRESLERNQVRSRVRLGGLDVLPADQRVEVVAKTAPTQLTQDPVSWTAGDDRSWDAALATEGQGVNDARTRPEVCEQFILAAAPPCAARLRVERGTNERGEDLVVIDVSPACLTGPVLQGKAVARQRVFVDPGGLEHALRFEQGAVEVEQDRVQRVTAR